MKRVLLVAAAASMLALSGSCSSSGGEEDVAPEAHVITPTDDTGGDKTAPADAGDELDVAPGEIGPDVDTETLLPDGEIPDAQVFPDGDDVEGPGDIIEEALPEVSDVIQDTYVDPVDAPFLSYGPMTMSMKGFLLGGKFAQFRFAQLDYWKYPEDQWDYLLRMVKEAGFNGVYTSACWRMHERVKGQLDFNSGRLNVASFLDKLSQQGLYAFFAAGPFIDGEAGGCLPDWVLAGAPAAASPIADGKSVPRTTDADYTTAWTQYFDQLNPFLADRLVTSFPQGPIVLYMLDTKVDLFFLLRDAESRISAEMQGMALPPQNPGLYLAQLRDAVKADGINIPLFVSVAGDFENGGRRIFATGDAPDLYPALEIDGDSPYDPIELKLWLLRKEMRNTNLHGMVYMAAPSVVVGLNPTPAHMSRMMMAGADAVVVKGFAATVLPPSGNTLGLARSDLGHLSAIKDAKVAFGDLVEDFPSLLSPSGLPRGHFFGFKMLNTFMERFGPAFAGRDLAYRIGANPNVTPYALKIANPSIGAIEDKWNWVQAGPAGGILEVMEDHFSEWYQFPKELSGRSTYFFDSSDGTLLVSLLNLDGLADGKNAHEREDILTKITLNGSEIPRHTSILVPAFDDVASGEPFLGWGHKVIPINNPLGPGYPTMEYASSSLAAVREFNGRMLIVSYGKELVKSAGVFFSEPGEISFSSFPAVPDITHNSLEGGGVHADSNGRIAVSFQHDGIGFVILTLGNGKQIQIMVTTATLGPTIHFAKDVDVSDIAIFGFDLVDSVSGGPEGLEIAGRMRAGQERLMVLTPNKPSIVKINGTKADCTWDATTLLLDCSFEPMVVAEASLPLTGVHTMVESYSGSTSDLGVSSYPDAFATVSGPPVNANDPAIGVSSGVAWYATEFQMGPVQPTLEGFFTVATGSDVVSLFVNGVYLGSGTALGNTPMKGSDVTLQMAAAGFRIPAGVVKEGNNTLAVRSIVWGRARENFPLVFSMAPLLPPSLDAFAPTVPHTAIKGIVWNALSGLAGNAKVSAGGVIGTAAGTWAVSKGGEDGFGRTFGVLKGWHNLPPNPSAASGAGFSGVSVPSAGAPLNLTDGQITWLTASFSSGGIPLQGGAELAIEGRSAIAYVYFNGALVGLWASDPEVLSQGLHSELPQGAGSRQVLADPDFDTFYSSENAIPLPESLLLRGGGTDNRVTCMVVDLSPQGDSDVPLPPLETVSGVGRITRFEVRPNTDEPWRTGAADEGTPLYWGPVDAKLEP